MKQSHQSRLNIGPFELDLRSGDLCAGDRKTVLQEQPLQVLRLLAEAGGELVTREEIRKKLWPNDTIVEFDHSINAAIMSLRRALGDSAEKPKYVETVVRRGYRLLVPVKWISADESVGGVSADGRGAAVRLQPDGGLLGKKVSHYRVLEIIGGGGMGLVYKAEDLKLGRQVALKFLPEELASDPVALQRFEREARTASSLDHPNVCTIYEVEEHAGEPFIVMQLLRGETLRDRLAELAAAKERLPLEKLLDFAVQVCSGLEAAHAKGIIHRDVKPANIFLTGSGQVKIVDFGLAKELVSEQQEFNNAVVPPIADAAAAVATGQSRALDRGVQVPELPHQGQAQAHGKTIDKPDATLTRFGVALGTAGYMSPEQIRGEKLDARTDIFSFGLVLYEMATGQRAFAGETAAIQQDAIQHREPTPARELAPEIPLRLEAVISKCLQKSRDQRFQSVTEIRHELSELQHELSLTPQLAGHEQKTASLGRAAPPISVAGINRLATASALLRRILPGSKLANKDTVVIADFQNKTGDPVFDASLTHALRVGLQQTPFLNPLAPDKVRRVLKKLGHSKPVPLTEERAKEICLKTNSAAVVTGTIADAGNQYKLELHVVRCDTGMVIARAESVADQRNLIVRQLGLATAMLRRRLGESRRSLQEFNQPLEVATTSSVDALKAYARAEEYRSAGDETNAVEQYRRAIEIDPDFALAHRELSQSLWPGGHRVQAIHEVKKTYELSTRLSKPDQLLAETRYFITATGDLEEAVSRLAEAVRIYPNWADPHHLLAHVLRLLGRFEEAVRELREAIRLDPDSYWIHANLMFCEMAMGRYGEAHAAFEAARALGLEQPARFLRYCLAFLQRDTASMEEQLRWAAEHPKLALSADLLNGEASAARYFGRMKSARELVDHAIAVAQSSGLSELAAKYESQAAVAESLIGNIDFAREAATRALALSSEVAIILNAALALAFSTEFISAGKLAEQVSTQMPQFTIVQNFDLPCIRAAIAIRQGKPADAIGILEPGYRYELAEGNVPRLFPSYLRGLAHLAAGNGHPASAEFRRVIEHPGIVWIHSIGALAHLQLARAQVMMCDKAAARESYQHFLTLWKDADPDMLIYEQSQAEYAKLT